MLSLALLLLVDHHHCNPLLRELREQLHADLFLEGEESLWCRWMALPGERSTSDIGPGGESQRSAHDTSLRYRSLSTTAHTNMKQCEHQVEQCMRWRERDDAREEEIEKEDHNNVLYLL